MHWRLAVSRLISRCVTEKLISLFVYGEVCRAGTKPIDMRIEIHIYDKNSVFFAVHKMRYHVVYIKDGIAVG